MSRKRRELPTIIAKRYALRTRNGRFYKWVPRVCESCFYGGNRAWPGCQRDDAREVKKFFGVVLRRAMPAVIDGQEVGYRCPFFTDPDIE
jgi:hypothetical protein